MKDKWLYSSKVKGMAVSLGVHLFFFGLVYYIQTDLEPGTTSNQPYTIALQSDTNHAVASKARTVETNNQIEQTSKEKKTAFLENKNAANKHLKEQVKNKKKHVPNIKKKQNIAHKEKTPEIDDRGLYKSLSTSPKKSEATLELAGWKWDKVPNPDDASEECGKIVFEIKVDENGEIISIQTIEKTVTPMVEKVYVDALRGLTFSKTSQLQSFSSISTGKVSFILVEK